MLSLVPSTDPALKIVSREVREDEYAEVVALYPIAQRLMLEKKGAGLAANQLGDKRRWFVWSQGLVINPMVISVSPVTHGYIEGCLSFPGQSVIINRPVWISVVYTDENLVKRSKVFSNMIARVFLHELDHLNGKTIV